MTCRFLQFFCSMASSWICSDIFQLTTWRPSKKIPASVERAQRVLRHSKLICETRLRHHGDEPFEHSHIHSICIMMYHFVRLVLSVNRSMYLSIHLSTYLTICLPIYLPRVCPSIYESTYLIYLCIYLSIYLSSYIYIYLI